MIRFKKLVLFVGIAIFMCTMDASAARAQHKTEPTDISGIRPRSAQHVCEIAGGNGGLKVFPWGKNDKEYYVLLEVNTVRTVFVYQECGGKSDVPIIDNPDKIIEARGPRWENGGPNDSGFRIYLSVSNMKALQNAAGYPLQIKTSKGTFHLRVVVIPNLEMAGQAYRNAKAINKLNQGQSDLYKRSHENKQQADEANRIAKSVRTRNSADVEVSLYGVFAGETPGRPGGGVGIATNIILGKFAKDVVQLGLSAHVGFLRYQLEVEEDVPNWDVNATEWDFGLSFLLRLQPFKYLYFDGNLGFTLRVRDFSDLMHWQETSNPYQVHMVNGETEKVPVFHWKLGIYFPVTHNFAFGVSYDGSVGLRKQICLLTAVSDDHTMCHAVNHSGVAEIRARF